MSEMSVKIIICLVLSVFVTIRKIIVNISILMFDYLIFMTIVQLQ